MTQLSFFLNPTSIASENIRKECICFLANKWPNEFKLLCQPMKYSPSVLHSLINILEEDLPSSILLHNNLLLNDKGQIQTKELYDRKAYVELNRGMSSILALIYILRGDCYSELIEGQKKEIALTRETYLKLHEQFHDLFKKNGIWDEQLLEVLFYAVLFNDLGKNIELKEILHSVYKVKDHDHDLILKNALEKEGLLLDFSRLNSTQQSCLRAMWHGGFNPSSFDTLEYPLSMSIHWVIAFAKIAKGNAALYLNMKKIEILADIAGVNGTNSKGALNLTEPVVTKFNKSFAILGQLLARYQQQLDGAVIYTSLVQKLEDLLLEEAKKLSITSANNFTPRTVLVLRLCRMLGLNDTSQLSFVKKVLKKLEQEHPDKYMILESEFSWATNTMKPTLWLECIPKFLWLMSNGNNVDLIDTSSVQNSLNRKENGLYAGLLILCAALIKIRTNAIYEELYTFENNELTKIASDSIKSIDSQVTIALFVAYDLVRIVQQASESNFDTATKLDAVRDLKQLWRDGVQINGRFITINKNQYNASFTFFDSNSSCDKNLTTQEQLFLDTIIKETHEHCVYLTSIGWADRASHFKVKNYTYQESIPGTIDISRFNQNQSIPDLVHAFNPLEKNTLFAKSDSSADFQAKEIKHSMNIRLYPTIKKIIEEHGAKMFLGSKLELQAYTLSVKEKLIIEIEVPSSVKFYISSNKTGGIKVYISGLVSHENLIQQLITLKLAGIELHNIPILGNTEHYKRVCRRDLSEFQKQGLLHKNVLIVAGCGLEDMVCSTLDQMFVGKINKNKFVGDLVSLTYVQSSQAPNLGFIVLNLNYGEICEEQVSFILEQFNCIGVFSGSAAGYIPSALQDKLPEIGARIPVQRSRHYSGEQVSLGEVNNNTHLHVPTIFVETFSWLAKEKEKGASTVDVETFYILKAIQNYLKANSHINLHIDIGVFISDYVGEKPLRSYNNVFGQYPEVLQSFVKQVLVKNITASHNNNRASVPEFSSQYVGLVPQKIAIEHTLKNEAVIDSIGKLWDKSEFSKRVHTPVTIGTTKNKERFSTQKAPRCLHLPIKLPGSDIRIPSEYQHFLDELQQIFNFEASINPRWNNLYAYLTVEKGFVPRAKSQRVPGPHVDGIPRDRDNPGSQLIDHAYLITDAIPTMFYTQQFDMNSYDPKIHHFFAIFRALSDESRTISISPFDIVLMNAYSVHTSTQTLEDVNRTFIRLEFSTLKFDRLGNSINPHFSSEEFSDYPFNYIARPIPENLFVPPSVYLNKPITNEDFLHESLDTFGRANLQAIFTQNSKFILKQSAYKNLDLIASKMMNEETQGIVLSYQGIPHAFLLYKIENRIIKLDTIFTLSPANGQEMILYGMKILNQVADRLSIQAGLKEGATPITISLDENNEDMIQHFLRAARIAKLEVTIEEVQHKTSIQESLTTKMGFL